MRHGLDIRFLLITQIKLDISRLDTIRLFQNGILTSQVSWILFMHHRSIGMPEFDFMLVLPTLTTLHMFIIITET